MNRTPQVRWILAALCVALAAVACITVNVYFPEAAVKSLSDSIEDAVAREAARASSSASLPPTASEPRARRHWLGVVLTALPAGTAQAAEEPSVADPGISSPAIRAIIASRAERLPALTAWKARGVVGEGSDGSVVVRSLDGVALAERAAAQKLVRAENADRERMFKEIAAATGTDLTQLSRIRATYATTLRERAAAGDWLQQADGQWAQKP